MFDLRLPSGIFFVIVGAILIAMGVAMPELRTTMTTVNVDLYAGLGIFAFGGFLLLMALRKPAPGKNQVRTSGRARTR